MEYDEIKFRKENRMYYATKADEDIDDMIFSGEELPASEK